MLQIRLGVCDPGPGPRRRPGPLAGPGTRSSRTGDSEEFRVGRIQVRPTQAEWRVRAQGLGA